MGDADGDHLGNDAGWSRDVAASDPVSITFTDLTTSAPPADEPAAPRRWRAAAGVTIALVALGGVLIALNGSDDDAQSQPDPSATIDLPPTTLSELPTVPTSTDPADSAGEIEVGGQLEQLPARVVDTQSYSALPRIWRNGSIDVPAGATKIGPMTVVVLTASGVLREVDLPSGTTRDFNVGASANFVAPSLAVGRSATLVTAPNNRGNPAGQPFSMVRAGEKPIDVVVPLQATEIRERPGTDEFVGLGIDLAASSLERVTIAGDGALSTVPIGFGPELSRGVLRFSPGGQTLLLDGGGVFEHDQGGSATLVAEGELISASSHHVLTRSCTDQYICSGVLVDGVSGERSVVRLDPEFVPSLADVSAQVSPDGNWLRYRSTDLGRVDRLLDLLTGEITSLSGLTSDVSEVGSSDVWAPDSSGFFRLLGGTLEFYDIATSDLVPFVNGPSPIVDFGVRLDLDGTPEPPIIEDANAGPDLQLIAIDENGSFHDLDLATGEVTTFPVRDARTRFGRTIVLSNGSDAYALAAARGPSAQLNRADSTSEELDDPEEAAVHRGPRNDTAWRPVLDSERDAGRADPASFRLFDVVGTDLGQEVSIPPGVSVVGGDVSGGLVIVGESAEISLLRPDSAELLTSRGDLLGLGSTAIIVRECGTEDGECRPTRIDRVSGDRQPVDAPAIADAQAAFDNGFGLIVENTVSPDGEVLIGPTSDGPLKWIVTDLATGSIVDIGSIRTGSRIVWSTGSTHAVFQTGDALFVYDRAAAQVVELSEAPPIVGFTVR